MLRTHQNSTVKKTGIYRSDMKLFFLQPKSRFQVAVVDFFFSMHQTLSITVISLSMTKCLRYHISKKKKKAIISKDFNASRELYAPLVELIFMTSSFLNYELKHLSFFFSVVLTKVTFNFVYLKSISFLEYKA